MNNSNRNTKKVPGINISFHWGLALAFAAIWLFGNSTSDIGGFKGTMYVTGFPFIFASSGDLIETTFSLIALIYDFLIGAAIFAAIVTLAPKKVAQRIQDAKLAE